MATKREVKEAGLTIPEILRVSASKVGEASEYVKIPKVVAKWVNKVYPAIVCTTFSVATNRGVKKDEIKRYTTIVQGLEEGKRIYQSRVKVSCTCPHHIYYGDEYALSRKGASDIKYSNGQPPVVRNPKNIPWCCKHVYRVLLTILKKKV